MFPRRPTELTTRSEQRVLAGTEDASARTLLTAEAAADTWRIVEVFSTSGTPFEAELYWSAGRGVGAHAKLTVAHAARIGVYARSLQVKARNLGPLANPVGVTIADGQAHTRNQWEATGIVKPDTPAVVSVPPFAHAVRLDVGEVVPSGSTELWLVDSDRVLRARIPLDQQPDQGVLVGGAHEVQVLSSTKSHFRLVFDLTL